MNLAAQQRKLLTLFRSPAEAAQDDDPYIRKVAQSRDLAEARRNILLWRFYVLERTAVLTFTLLKQRRLLTQALTEFIARHNISPFRETQAPAFLEMTSAHADTLVAAVAQFELALIRVRAGDPACYVVPWPVEPHGLLNALARGFPLPNQLLPGRYQIHVAGHFPGQFQIIALDAAHVDQALPPELVA